MVSIFTMFQFIVFILSNIYSIQILLQQLNRIFDQIMRMHIHSCQYNEMILNLLIMIISALPLTFWIRNKTEHIPILLIFQIQIFFYSEPDHDFVDIDKISYLLIFVICGFLPFLGHPDKPNVQGKNAATTVLKPLEFAQCLLTGSLLQGDFTEFFQRYILLFFL